MFLLTNLAHLNANRQNSNSITNSISYPATTGLEVPVGVVVLDFVVVDVVVVVVVVVEEVTHDDHTYPVPIAHSHP